jgi:hypothetical protein
MNGATKEPEDRSKGVAVGGLQQIVKASRICLHNVQRVTHVELNGNKN